MLDISPVLDFVSKTGERCVFFNPETGGFFVIAPLKDSEKIGASKKAAPFAGARPSFQRKEETFVEPWQTAAPNFVPEPPVE